MAAGDGTARGLRRCACAQQVDQARADLRPWLSFALRCRLEQFKKLAITIKEWFGAVVVA